MTDLHQRLITHILNGGAPKEFAFDNGIHKTTASRIMTEAGIRKVFITKAEHEAIIEMRKLLKK